jgi:16S rRNA (guanine966-N2)-methyltransferase
MIRIIAGKYRGKKLMVADVDGLRPTTDRTRGSLFNLLMHRLSKPMSEMDVLDAFAGSGALGFEALSRGAKSVTFIEADTKAFRQLQASQQSLAGVTEVLKDDAYAFFQTREQRFDLIFLDPPFGKTNFETLLKIVASSTCLAPQGLVVLEHPTENDIQIPREFAVLVDRAYGRSNIVIMEYRN